MNCNKSRVRGSEEVRKSVTISSKHFITTEVRATSR